MSCIFRVWDVVVSTFGTCLKGTENKFGSKCTVIFSSLCGDSVDKEPRGTRKGPKYAPEVAVVACMVEVSQ